MEAGFIGFGHLGAAIARRLKEQGVDLLGWNRNAAKVGQAGIQSAASPRELVGRVSTLFLCVFDSNAVRAVLDGPDGLLAGGVRGKTIIDLTTHHPRMVLDVHREFRKGGGRYLEAPVLGSVIPASLGKLTVLVSGDPVVYEGARPLLGLMGEKQFYLGEPGRATAMKLANNVVLATIMCALAEGAALGERSGIPRETVLEILAAGAGSSAVLNAKREKMLKEDYSPHFAVNAITKDLGCAREAAGDAGMVLRIAEAARSMYDRVQRGGHEEEDMAVVFRDVLVDPR
jgi:3-hydroxyisobutyrate dehydrogenase